MYFKTFKRDSSLLWNIVSYIDWVSTLRLGELRSSHQFCANPFGSGAHFKKKKSFPMLPPGYQGPRYGRRSAGGDSVLASGRRGARHQRGLPAQVRQHARRRHLQRLLRTVRPTPRSGRQLCAPPIFTSALTNRALALPGGTSWVLRSIQFYPVSRSSSWLLEFMKTYQCSLIVTNLNRLRTSSSLLLSFFFYFQYFFH